jgi:hypothetical protein
MVCLLRNCGLGNATKFPLSGLESRVQTSLFLNPKKKIKASFSQIDNTIESISLFGRKVNSNVPHRRELE